MTTQTATQPQPATRPTEPIPGVCFWCASTADVETFRNTLDFDPLRDAEPPLMSLCAACLAAVGIMLDEPDCCPESGHRSGCNGREHSWLGEAQ